MTTTAPFPDEITRVVALLKEKKAENICIIDLKDVAQFSQYFIICSALVEKHAQTLAEHLRVSLKKTLKLMPLHVEGFANGQWILTDYGYFVCHIMLAEARSYYDLERLWQTANIHYIPDPA